MHAIDEAAGDNSTPFTWDAQLIIDLTQSGLPSDTPVYIYCVGQVGDTFYYLDDNFMPQVMATSDNTVAANIFPGMDVGKNLAVAFNRGIVVSPSGSVVTSLNDGTCAQSVSTFYPDGGTFNPWAMAFHTWNKNGLAYAFPYDDVCDQNPTIPPPGESLVAFAVRITLGGFWH